MSILKPLLLVALVSMTVSCAQVGSKRWCSKLKEKPKNEWTFQETKSYTANCFFKKKES
jgi:hypothetical protein